MKTVGLRLVCLLGLLLLMGCTNPETIVEPFDFSDQNQVPDQNQAFDQNQALDQNQSGLFETGLLGLPYCGETGWQQTGQAAEQFDPEADAALVCLGEHLLNNCSASEIWLDFETGALAYGIQKEADTCYSLLQYGEDTGQYPDKNLKCPSRSDILIEDLGELAFEKPGTLASNVYLIMALQAISPNDECTGSLLDSIMQDQNQSDQNQSDQNQMDQNQGQDQNVLDGEDAFEPIEPSDSVGSLNPETNVRTFSILVDEDGFTPNKLNVKKGEYLKLRVQATDKRHNFYSEYQDASSIVTVDKIIEKHQISAVSFRVPARSSIAFSCYVNCNSSATGTIYIDLN